MNIEVTQQGTGATPTRGQTVVAHYHGTFPDGRVFDSSRDRGTPFKFKIGIGQVIRAWDEGFATMKVGTKATITAPPEYAYGSQGAGNVIPPNATLVFEVELLGLEG